MHTGSKNKKYLLATAIVAALSSPLPALAAGADYYLQIEGIKGESNEKGFEDAIEVLSWGWGMSENAKGQACVQDMSLLKELDIATAPLINGFDSGREFASAKLTYRANSPIDGQRITRMTITLGAVRVSSLLLGGSGGGGVPTDQLSLSYSKVTGVYYPDVGADGEFMVIPEKCD